MGKVKLYLNLAVLFLSFVDVLTSRRDLIEDAVIEAIEDVGLARAMEDGRTGEYVDAKEFRRKLNSKLERTLGGSEHLKGECYDTYDCD